MGQTTSIDRHDGRFVDLEVGAPCAKACGARDHPIAFSDGLDRGPSGDYLKTSFVPRNCARRTGRESSREGRMYWVFPLNLVDIGWVEGRGERAESDETGVRWSDRVSV